MSEFSASPRADLLPPTLKSPKKEAKDVTRVIVKEKAVQTLDPALTCQCAKGKCRPKGPRGGMQAGLSGRALRVCTVGVFRSRTRSPRVCRSGLLSTTSWGDPSTLFPLPQIRVSCPVCFPLPSELQNILKVLRIKDSGSGSQLGWSCPGTSARSRVLFGCHD